jgi:DNA-binding CsgD family transcriptional regulator
MPFMGVAGMAIRLARGTQEILLSHGLFLVGRSPDVDVRIAHPEVSRHHAAIRVGHRHATLEDLASSNGVLLNGRRVYGVTAVGPGDRITLGSQVLQVLAADASPTVENDDDQGAITAVTDMLHDEPTRRERPPHPTPPNSIMSLSLLSDREREVLRRVAAGLSQREIGEQLGISPKTVETYRGRIVDKLGLPTRASMIQYAVNVGLLRPE